MGGEVGRLRASIAGLMAVIAAVAANLALLRSVYERDLGLAFQLGLLRRVAWPRPRGHAPGAGAVRSHAHADVGMAPYAVH